jgi:hypothetical protein
MSRFFLIEASEELDFELYQTFKKVYGTPAELSKMCGIPQRKIILRESYWMTQQFFGGEPRWRLYAVLVDEWMDKRLEITNLFRSQSLVDKNEMQELPDEYCFKVMIAIRFAFEFCLQPFSHEQVCIISNDPGTIPYVTEKDPRQTQTSKPYPCLPQTQLDKYPLKQLNQSARNFFKYALPVLERICHF